jgi:hypothetical protein
MRTALIILGGLLLFGACLASRNWLGGGGPDSIALAVRIFIPLWLCAALFNLYIGVTRAGYSLREELPIFAVIFLIPVVVATLVWYTSRH